MKKVFALVLGAVFVFVLTGCELQTPEGTLTIGFDADKKSEQTKIVDTHGNEFVIDADEIADEVSRMENEDGSLNVTDEGFIGGVIDTILGGVALPQGTDAGELKDFVFDFFGNPVNSIDKLLGGVDLPNGVSSGELKNYVYDAISSLGIDLHDIGNEGKIEQAVSAVLQEHGINPDDVQVSVEEWVANMEAETNAGKTAG